MWATLLQVQTPECAWCRHASTHHPNVRFNVTSYYSRPNGSAIEVVEMTGQGWATAVEEIRQFPGVEEVEVLDESDQSGRVRIAASGCFLPAAIEASGVLPQLPFEVAGGCDKWLIISPKDKAREFYEQLRKDGVNVDIVFSGEYAPESKLTPRQQEILAFAIQHGYYDYPRRITLTKLAEKMGLAKSTLSQALMVVESEVVKNAAVASGPVGPEDKPRRNAAPRSEARHR